MLKDLGKEMNFMTGFKHAFCHCLFRSYYEANDVTSAINVIEEAFSKHQGLVSMEDVNIAAELYISNKQYDKALEVGICFCVLQILKNYSSFCLLGYRNGDF